MEAIGRFIGMDGSRPDSLLSGEAIAAHRETTRKLVRSMLMLTGMSASALAKAAGLTPSTVNRFMNRPVTHTLSQRTMLALLTEALLQMRDKPESEWDSIALKELAPALAVYEQGILETQPEVEDVVKRIKAMHGNRPETTTYRPEPGPASDLPVVMVSTQAVNVLAGEFNNAPLRTQRPAFLAADPHAFAIMMPDESMMPRFDTGDMLFVSPARTLEGFKVDVVLERADGGFLIGKLIAITADTVALGSLFPVACEFYERDTLRGIHRVVGLVRL